MKLKDGGWYMNRGGVLDRIKKDGSSFSKEYPFSNDRGYRFSENGRSYDDITETPWDPIKEVRVTIEEVEPVSEFIMLERAIDDVFVHGLLLDEYRRDCIINEIKRLQKLFEVNEND
jgi:hypothetical protein